MYRLLAVLFTLANLSTFSSSERVVCYYTASSKYNPPDQQFEPLDIDPQMCTHIIYAFAGLDETGEVVLFDEPEILLVEMDELIYLTAWNTELKILGSIGGSNVTSSTFSKVAADPELRASLNSSIYNFIRTYEFHGIDIDWEFPGQGGGDPDNDATNFVTFLSELRPLLDVVNGVLSVTVTAKPELMNISWPDVKAISDNVDFINVMNYRETSEKFVAYMDETYKQQQEELNVVAGIKRWIDGGADPEKLNLGLATYGRRYSVDGAYIEDISFNEICQLGPEWEEEWNGEQQNPIKRNGTENIVYEDVKSLGLKADIVKELNLGGAAVWSLDNDDFLGHCGDSYPLINTIKDHVNSKK